jgi:hypothetical protein
MAPAQPGPRPRRPEQDRDAAVGVLGRGLAHATRARRAAGPGRAGHPHRAAQPAAGRPPVGLPSPGVRGTGYRDQLQHRPDRCPGGHRRQRGGPGSQLTGALARLAAARPGGIARSGVAAVPSGPRPHAGHPVSQCSHVAAFNGSTQIAGTRRWTRHTGHSFLGKPVAHQLAEICRRSPVGSHVNCRKASADESQ